MVILWQDYYGKSSLRKILLKYGWEKVSNWDCSFVHREKGLFLSVYVNDIKLAGKKQNINPMWKVLNKEVDLEEPTLCVFGSHTFVPISWMCKKQTSVSHSSTESEIISLDAGLRLDGIPTLDLRDLIVSVLGNMNQNHHRTVRPVVNTSEICSPTSHDSQT